MVSISNNLFVNYVLKTFLSVATVSCPVN